MLDLCWTLSEGLPKHQAISRPIETAEICWKCMVGLNSPHFWGTLSKLDDSSTWQRSWESTLLGAAWSQEGGSLGDSR